MTLNQQRLHAIILQRKDCRDFIQNPGSFNLNLKNSLALTLELRPGRSLSEAFVVILSHFSLLAGQVLQNS